MPTWAPIHYFFAVDKRIYPSEPTFNHTCLHRNCKFNHHRTHTSPLRERNLIKCRCSEPEPDVTELATGPMSRKKGDLAQAGPASTRARAGTPTASPADTVRTFTLHPPPLDRCQALCPSSKKLNTHTFPAGAALTNPNTTREGRRHAKWELRRMVRAPFCCCSSSSQLTRVFLASRAVEVRLMCRS